MWMTLVEHAWFLLISILDHIIKCKKLIYNLLIQYFFLKWVEKEPHNFVRFKSYFKSILYKDQFMLLKLYNEIKILKKTLKTKHVVFIQINNQLNETSLGPSTHRKITFVLVMCNAHYLFNPTNQANHMHCKWWDTLFFYWWLELKAPNMFGAKPYLTENSYIIFLNAPFVSIKKPYVKIVFRIFICYQDNKMELTNHSMTKLT